MSTYTGSSLSGVLKFKIAFKRFFGMYKREQKIIARNEHKKLKSVLDKAHFIQIQIMIDGKWTTYKGDYIKYL